MGHDAGLLRSIDEIASENSSAVEQLLEICRILAAQCDGYDWVGFYVVDPLHPRELVLGPFVGEPTEHTRIPFGHGICGQAAAESRTVVVYDVARECNYLACSFAVKSEIVVPVRAAGHIVGELDIDSHQPRRFGDRDRELLEAIAATAAGAVDRFRLTLIDASSATTGHGTPTKTG
ncbi:GAF domain-containing protein [Candidatus Fermentibacteria bacterium]|nr:GAF domain-containing protein [Candidatus Fermentibacteria bacterium]